MTSELSPTRALNDRERVRIDKGLAFPVVCRRCGVYTGTSPERGRLVLCPPCNWKEAFELAEVQDPRTANAGQARVRLAEVFTDGASILPASSEDSLPGGVQEPSVNTSGLTFEEDF